MTDNFKKSYQKLVVRRELSVSCSRGSHEHTTHQRRCRNAWGKCQCDCHVIVRSNFLNEVMSNFLNEDKRG